VNRKSRLGSSLADDGESLGCFVEDLTRQGRKESRRRRVACRRRGNIASDSIRRLMEADASSSVLALAFHSTIAQPYPLLSALSNPFRLLSLAPPS
jgi:hypothetical protein